MANSPHPLCKNFFSDSKFAGTGLWAPQSFTEPAALCRLSTESLASHPLIHTAEGEFFCRVAAKACERLDVPVTGIRRCDVEEQAKAALGKAANATRRTIAMLGKSIGPPWTADHKAAALAALTILERR